MADSTNSHSILASIQTSDGSIEWQRTRADFIGLDFYCTSGTIYHTETELLASGVYQRGHGQRSIFTKEKTSQPKDVYWQV